MKDFSKTPATRRAALKTGLGLLGAAGAIGMAAPARAQSSGKVAPASVGYVDKSATAGQVCSTCTQWVAPNGCLLVSGTIAPGGWCQLYSPKA